MDEPRRGRRRREHLGFAREYADTQRTRMRMSKAGLARVAGISVDTVRHFLDGKNVDDSSLVAISSALGFDDLLLVDLADNGPPAESGTDGQKDETSAAIKAAMEQLGQASESTRREILDYIRYKLGA